MIIYRIQLPLDIYINKKFNIYGDRNIDVESLLFESAYKSNELLINYDYHKSIYGFKLSMQEISNYLVHYNIWNIFLESEEEYCMILESNVELEVNSKDILETIQQFPKDLDIFIPYDREKIIRSFPQKSRLLLNTNIRELFNTESYFMGYKWGNSIYFLSKSGADKLLKINYIMDRLDNTLVRMGFNEEINFFYDEVYWLNQSVIDWKEWPERNEIMWNTILEISPWTDERIFKAQKLLKMISQTAIEVDTKLILQGGSHLGYIQHNGIMPWDDDIDIGILEGEAETFFENLMLIEGIHCCKCIEHWSNTEYYKIWLESGELIEGYDYKFPFVDVWLYRIVYPDYVFKNGIICPNSAKYNLESIVFENALFYVTGNSLEVLDSRYTNWRSEIYVYSYSHRLEQNYFPKLRINIRTDSSGRMISRV